MCFYELISSCILLLAYAQKKARLETFVSCLALTTINCFYHTMGFLLKQVKISKSTPIFLLEILDRIKGGSG